MNKKTENEIEYPIRINRYLYLKNYCSNKCKTCGEYDNVITNNYLSYNDQ